MMVFYIIQLFTHPLLAVVVARSELGTVASVPSGPLYSRRTIHAPAAGASTKEGLNNYRSRGALAGAIRGSSLNS
jgi:hypothetical protein